MDGLNSILWKQVSSGMREEQNLEFCYGKIFLLIELCHREGGEVLLHIFLSLPKTFHRLCP